MTALQLLGVLPISEIKLAPRFAALDASDQNEARLLVRAARDSGKRVVATRAPSARAAAALFAMGVDAIQGGIHGSSAAA